MPPPRVKKCHCKPAIMIAKHFKPKWKTNPERITLFCLVFALSLFTYLNRNQPPAYLSEEEGGNFIEDDDHNWMEKRERKVIGGCRNISSYRWKTKEDNYQVRYLVRVLCIRELPLDCHGYLYCRVRIPRTKSSTVSCGTVTWA